MSLDAKITIKEGSFLKNIHPIRTELIKDEEVFIYFLKSCSDVKGILHKNDDIIKLYEGYDVIVNKVYTKPQGRLIHSEVYHSLEKGDIVNIKISQISQRGQGMFKINGYLGFVTSNNPEIGEELFVKVEKIKSSKSIYWKILETTVEL